jgi:hypothetical protein
METTKLTFMQALKGGFIAGIIAAGANNLWTLIANVLGATIPSSFVFPVTVSSIFPLVIGAVIYFLLMRFAPKPTLIWIVLSLGFTLVSFVPVFNTPQLPDGTTLDSTFPLLVGPMHAISGVLAIWAIPKFSK